MKNLLIITTLLGLISATGVVAVSKTPVTETNNRSGCCSYHGGVAYGDKSGYYMCNDESQSPSCT